MFAGTDHKEIKNRLRQLEKQLGINSQDIDLLSFFAEETDVQTIIAECNTYPVFSDKKVVKVYDFDKLDKKKWLKYLQNPSEKTVLILLTSKTDKELNKDLLTSIQQQGHVEIFKDKYANELSQIISQSLKQANISYDPELIEHIIEREENSIGNINALIYSIKDYCKDGRTLTIDAIPDILISSKIPSVFELIDTLFVRDLAKSLRLFHQIITEDAAYGQIIYLIFRQLKLIWQVKSLSSQRIPQSDIMRQLKLPVFIAKKVSQQANNFSFSHLEKLIHELVNLDFSIKSNDKSLAAMHFEIYLSQFQAR